jgi:hypothetical protein
VILILLLCSSSLFGKELKLTDITVNGLSRTKIRTVLNITGLKMGMTVDENTADDVRQKLLEVGIFRNDISVLLTEKADETAEIDIILSDRWTFIPLPVGFVSSDSWLAGAVLIESNLAGLNQTLVAGTFISGDTVLGFGAWNIPDFYKSTNSFGISGSYYLGLEEYLDVTGNNTLASFDKSELSTRMKIGNTFLSELDWEYSTGINWFKGESSQDIFKNFDKNQMFWQNSLTFGWDNLYYMSFFNRGWSIKLKNTLHTAFQDMKTEPELGFSLARNFVLLEKHLLKAKINSGWQTKNREIPISIGGSEGNRALPTGNVAVSNYVNGIISVEPVVLKLSWGIFTTPAYYEAGIFTPYLEDEPVFWHGPGIGFRFYVDKVAIPALGADFTWDLQNKSFRVAVSIGGSGN